MTITTKQFSDSPLYGYLAYPERSPRSGVLILPTIFGVNEFARGYAEALAGEGFLASVWDINSGLPPVTDYKECIRRARTLNDNGVMRMVSDWMTWMLEDGGVASVGVLGFCIGGRFALLAAAQDSRVRACAVAYASIENRRLENQEQDALALAADISCPVHMVQAGKDHVTDADTYQSLKATLSARSAPTSIHIYPNAEHGFMHREQPETNRTAAALAVPQVNSFLAACLT